MERIEIKVANTKNTIVEVNVTPPSSPSGGKIAVHIQANTAIDKPDKPVAIQYIPHKPPPS